jgi:Flagellar hook-length control protein FliK
MINMLPATNIQPTQNGPLPMGEKPEKIDLYADLFAALFTVPMPMKPVEPIAIKVSPVTSGEASNGIDSEASTPETPEFGFSTLQSGPIFPPEIKSPITLTPMPTDRPEFLGPPVELTPGEKEDIAPPIQLGPHDRKPIPLTDTCGLPGDGGIKSIPKSEFIMTRDVTTSEILLDQIENGDLLELPTVTSPNAGPLVPEQAAGKPTVGKEFEVIAADALPSVFPTSIAPTREFVRLPREFQPIEKKDLSIERLDHEAQSDGTLLETFTANVLIDSRPKEFARAATAGHREATEFAGSITEVERLKKPEAEQGSEFSFDSSVSGEPAALRPAPFGLPEGKLRRAILDQVGSNLNDLAANKLEQGDKREIKIRLKPEELGTVEITLIKNGEGTIEAHFVTDNPQTQYLLEQTLAQLRESLENSGIKVGSLETSCSSAFSDAYNGGGSTRDSGSSSGDSRMPLRNTFDEPLAKDEEKANRLVNLRA